MGIRGVGGGKLMARGGPGNLVLALLAGRGTERLGEIARRAGELAPPARVRALVQLTLLSGLRGVSEQLKMEMKNMGSGIIDVRKNAILRDWMEEAKAEGREEGREKGREEGREEGLAAGKAGLLQG